MKLLLNSHVSFDVCLLLVLLPVLSLAQPYVNGSRKENLKTINHQMKILGKIARGPFRSDELDLDIQLNFTALPRIASRAKNVQTQQLNTTLLLLHSGLQSFRFHFDWLRQVRQNRSMIVPQEIKDITFHLERIGQLLQKQMDDLPPNLVPPQLPRLTNPWDIYTSSIVVHRNLHLFCLWARSALNLLMRTSL